MKKIFSFLVIAATLAFAGMAFANDVDNESDVKALSRYATTPGNVGAVTGKAPTYNGSSPVDGTYSAKVYYFGEISDTKKATAGIELEAGATSSSGVEFKYGQASAASSANTFGTTSSSSAKINKAIDVTVATPVTYTIGSVDSSSWVTDKTKATLSLTPTEVKLVIPPVSIPLGKSQDAKIAISVSTLAPTFGAAFTATTTAADAPKVTAKSGANDTLVIDASSAKVGTYTYKVSTGASSSLKVTESGGASGIEVANFPTAATEVGELTVTVTDPTPAYVVEPSSATWDGSSTDTVKFAVKNMAASDLKDIAVKRPGEEDFRSVGAEYYTVTSITGGIEIELKLGSLASWLTASGDYLFEISDKDGHQAHFTLKVTRSSDPQVVVPEWGVDPSQKGEAPDLVQFGIAQTTVGSDDVKKLLPPAMSNVVGADGKIMKDEAAKLTRTDPDTLTVLPTVATKLDTNKTIAAFTFNVTGRELVSEEVDGIHWSDATIHKMFVSEGSPASVTLAPAMTWDAIEDGTFMILDVNGSLLAEDYVIKRNARRFQLVVYIEDDIEFDLDSTPLYVVDPVAIQERGRTPKSRSNCDTGLGLAALAGLAAITARRRSR